jgi:hypothetical protein
LVAVRASELTLLTPLGAPALPFPLALSAADLDPPEELSLDDLEPRTPPSTAPMMTNKATITPMMIHIFLRLFFWGCSNPLGDCEA